MRTTDLPLCDSRGYDDIMQEMAVLAATLTPEWKLDLDDPDAGTALACVFGRRFAETIECFNNMLENHKRSFYNHLGASLLPAIPARGLVQFYLAADDVEGTLIQKGFKLFSPMIDGQGTRMIFETEQEVFVRTLHLEEIIYADNQKDLLCYWDKAKDEPFCPNCFANKQEHKLIFFHPIVERLCERSKLYLTIGSDNASAWLMNLANPSCAIFSQENDSGLERLNVFLEGERLRLATRAKGGRLELSLLQIEPFQQLAFDGILLSSEGDGYEADNVFVNGELETRQRFEVFGTSPVPYDTVVFQCDAALAHIGANITMRFMMGFETIELGEIEKPKIPNRLFVWKKNLPKVERTKVSIEDVVWEYWNGNGFAPIRELLQWKNLFSGLDEAGQDKGAARYELTFTCPEDIAPVLIASVPTICIRARVKMIENAYILPSKLYRPWIDELRFSYCYQNPVRVQDILVVNNGERTAESPTFPFKELPSSSLFFGFDNSPAGGMTTLFVEHDMVIRKAPSWSVYTNHGWKAFQPISGGIFASRELVSFDLADECAKHILFGREGYWIRAAFGDNLELRINKVLLNCTPVVQQDTVESYCSDILIETLRLEHKNILGLKIYQNIGDRNGAEAWDELHTGWNLDRASGRVLFQPALSLKPNTRTIKLCYRHGGGEAGNFPAGQEFVPSLAVGFVRGAANPIAFHGGRDTESDVDALCRLSQELRHQGRPVTKNDYVDLLMDDDIEQLEILEEDGGLAITISPKASSENDHQLIERVRAKLEPLRPIGMGQLRVEIANRVVIK